MKRRAGRAARGQAMLVLAIAGLVLLVMIVLGNAVLVREDVKQTTSVGKLTKAFHAAEAGLDRGAWKLQESPQVWENAAAGVAVSGYDGNTTYTDSENNEYRIWFSSDTGGYSNAVKVKSSGRDRTRSAVRTLEAVYQREGVQGAIQAVTISQSGNAKIHWGKIMSTDYISLSGNADVFYPRKYSRGKIECGNKAHSHYDTDGIASSDDKEYWSYNYPPGVPDIPSPNISKMKDDAKANPWTGPGAAQGSYWDAKTTITDLRRNVFTTYYFAASVTLSGNKHLRGIIVAEADLTISGGPYNADGYGKYTTSGTDLNAAEVWKEYQVGTTINGTGPGDTAAVDEYPGDAGLGKAEDFNFVDGCASHGSLGGSQQGKAGISFKGFMYGTGAANITTTGNTAIHGAIMVASGAQLGSGGWDIFYDPKVVVEFAQGPLRRVSWNEVAPSWP